MTSTTAAEVARRALSGPAESGFAADLLGSLTELLSKVGSITWPSPRYREDPVGFFREVLGIEPWSRQVELLEAVRDNKRVACRSGHRVAKSNSAAGLALWWFASQVDARVVLTSKTGRQVDQILWRELRMMHRRAGKCVACKQVDPDDERIPRPCPHSAKLDGELAELARTGLHSEDFRQVLGFTAKEADAITGIAGRRILFIADEAAGIPQDIFNGIEGNRAGGAKLLLLGNPTRNEGEFFEAFEGNKAKFYKTLTISSEESPNVIAGRTVIEGLCERDWVEEKKEEWGEKSPLYIVRVTGKHALHEDGKIFSIQAIADAEQRWDEVDGEGRLWIGLDPASASEGGDESAFSLRRGLRQIALVTFRGLSPEAHIAHLLGLIKQYGIEREVPVVVLDREGKVGAENYAHMLAYLSTIKGRQPFELVAVRASDDAPRNPLIYDRFRDELAANLESWIRDGGAIVTDAKLAKEMHIMVWLPHRGGRVKLLDKITIRRELKRSPDRFDALTLSVWEPSHLTGGRADGQGVRDDDDDEDEDDLGCRDPYRSGKVDPYTSGR